MDREQCWGVGQVVFSGKDQLVAVRPLDGVLHMAMLNFEQEIRRPADVLAAHKSPRPESKKIHLAQTHTAAAQHSAESTFTVATEPAPNFDSVTHDTTPALVGPLFVAWYGRSWRLGLQKLKLMMESGEL